MAPRTTIVMGKGELAAKVADWFLAADGYELMAVVPNMPESDWTVSLREWAAEKGVVAIESGLVKDIPGIEGPGWHVDLAVSVTYNRILQPEFLQRAGKAVNIHNGPLPQYRGVNPINWALKNGECRHGVTIHEMTPSIDDGPVLAQRFFPIDPAVDEVIDVYRRCLEHGWELFQELMPRLWLTRAQLQDESLARYYSARDFERLGERRFFTRAESV